MGNILSLPFIVPSKAHGEDFPTSAGRKGCKTVSDPSRTAVTCTGDVLLAIPNNTRLSGISATENGVSTSAVKNPSRFAAPWNYSTETDQASKAFSSLQAALLKVEPTVEIDTVDTNFRSSGYYYLHATLSSPATGTDDIEFIIRPEDRLALFRSASRTSVFVYPLTQPVTDGLRNRKRMEKIRDELGWQDLSY
ncbi:hypothetical protein FisN_22Hu151 [Fistulifera solaris]|jgi:uncharacterized protein (DUF1499 family)|uniref:Uncharacterized protein n=1 Tax=Fistulifera solaris TaxID=1519565 RepID=A0A1Z5JQ71_FISSO|nr:hypothetical protein FisN_22Hu151 [Fistulifera solaris]|eukprot:GAX15992.1 hypothetical protein FisN_22Hu151 [Fistulifera solaris]